MPLAPQFCRAVVPPIVRLGGRRLRPLTLGHAVLLRAIGSPFAPYPVATISSDEVRVTNGSMGAGGSPSFETRNSKFATPTIGDVALARFILTRPWAEARDTMDGWWQRQRLTLWGLLHSREWMIGALLRHILTDAAVPPYRVLERGPVPEEAGPLGAPTELRLVAFLVSQGYDHERALDTPVALAWWLSLASSEAIGGLRLQPELDPAAPAPVPAKEYAPEVMAAWGQSQQARHKAGRDYDPATDSLEAFALQLGTRNSELGTADTGGAA